MRKTPIQALWSKHTDLPQVPIHSLCLQSKHGEKNADPSTLFQARRSAISVDPLSLSSIQARWEERQSKHSDPSTPICHKRRSTLSISVGVSVCGCVWLCGVSGWFCGWFFILSVGVCVSKEEADDEGGGCADGEERKKKERN